MRDVCGHTTKAVATMSALSGSATRNAPETLRTEPSPRMHVASPSKGLPHLSSSLRTPESVENIYGARHVNAQALQGLLTYRNRVGHVTDTAKFANHSDMTSPSRERSPRSCECIQEGSRHTPLSFEIRFGGPTDPNPLYARSTSSFHLSPFGGPSVLD